MTAPSPRASTHPRVRLTDRLERWPFATLVVVAFSLFTCFLRLGGTALMSMEGMIVNGAAAMMDNGNWWVPRVYGDVYTYKPALGYWLSAIPQSLFDQPGEWLLRAPFAGTGVLLACGLFALFGWLLGPRPGALIGMAASGGGLFIDKIRIAEFDGPITAGVGLAIGAAVVALSTYRQPADSRFASPKAQALLWLGSYLCLLLGFLAKGMPALMVFGPGLLGAAIATRTVPRLFRLDHVLAATLFVGAAASYLWLAVRADGTMVFDQPVGEAGIMSVGWTLKAFGLTLTKPLLITAAFLPWTLALLRSRSALLELPPLSAQVLRAALGFLGGAILAFCLVSTHEMRYYLPTAAAAAIASGVALEHLVSKGVQPRAMLIATRVLQVLVAIGAFAATYDRGILTLGVAVPVVLTAALAWTRPVRGSVLGQFVVCSLLLAVSYSVAIMPGKAYRRDTRAVAEVFDRIVPQDATIWMVAPADHAGKHATLLHYLDREVRILPETRSPDKPESEIQYVIYTDVRAHLLAKTHRVEDIELVEHPYFDYHLARVLGRADDIEPAN